MIKGKFIDNLPKVYGIYTGGFIGFIIFVLIKKEDKDKIYNHTLWKLLRKLFIV